MNKIKKKKIFFVSLSLCQKLINILNFVFQLANVEGTMQKKLG